MNVSFNSFDTDYKYPIGACKEKSNIHFKIFLDKGLCCRNASLIILNNNFNIIKNYSMFWCGNFENNTEAWECDFTPLNIGVLYYYFKINTDTCTKFIIRDILGVSKIVDNIEQEKSFWQQTVYKKDFVTPDWLKGGIMYQIFPDRFNYSGIHKNNVPNDRIINSDWECPPNNQPNSNGIIKNNDYYAGDLKGIELKLDYLKSLGVSCIYLNPIFEAHSNHRYNVADFNNIDPLLGVNKDFYNLCLSAKNKNIKIIIDGVFSHTGSDSIYFNKENRYPNKGAYNSTDSPYFNWYKFSRWPDIYSAWWNFDTLPEVNENNNDYCNFICGKNGIIKKWLSLGTSGWRLDVADELPDSFIKKIRNCMKAYDKDSILIGEVWEDASNKESYSVKREYLLGDELDSVMNYPFRSAIIDFIKGNNAFIIMDNILTIIEHYPKPVIDSLMNLLGTHDTERILSIISNKNNDDVGTLNNSIDNYNYILKIFFICIAMQYTLPGIPCIYYGDEVGVYGGKDPFCRSTFPWNHENQYILKFYKEIGNFRNNSSVLSDGYFSPYHIDAHFISYMRYKNNNFLLNAFNMYNHDYIIKIPPYFKNITLSIGNAKIKNSSVILPPYSFAILEN